MSGGRGSPNAGPVPSPGGTNLSPGPVSSALGECAGTPWLKNIVIKNIAHSQGLTSVTVTDQQFSSPWSPSPVAAGVWPWPCPSWPCLSRPLALPLLAPGPVSPGLLEVRFCSLHAARALWQSLGLPPCTLTCTQTNVPESPLLVTCQTSVPCCAPGALPAPASLAGGA